MMDKKDLVVLINKLENNNKLIHKSVIIDENYAQVRSMNKDMKNLLEWWDEYLYNLSEIGDENSEEKNHLFVKIDKVIKDCLKKLNELIL